MSKQDDDNDFLVLPETRRDAPLRGQASLPEKNIKLWLDDIRDPCHFGHIGWTWVKTADEAITLLASGCVCKASLDHDLTISQTIGYPDQEKTGLDVVCWMEENNVWPPGGVLVHSMNPEGRFKMEQAIQRRMEASRQLKGEKNEKN